MLAPSSQRETLKTLRQQLQEWCGASREAFSSGLDCLFPDGIHRGTLIEYLAESGSGAVALSLLTAKEACRDGQALIVVDRKGCCYPPAFASREVNMAEAIFVRPRTRKDELWALNQALSCQGVGAVLAWPGKLDPNAFRALQLAAERGGAVGLFVRPANVRGHPSWSETQLFVTPLPDKRVRRLRIEVVRSRNGRPGAIAVVELDDATGTLQTSGRLSLASELAAATTAAGEARA